MGITIKSLAEIEKEVSKDNQDTWKTLNSFEPRLKGHRVNQKHRIQFVSQTPTHEMTVLHQTGIDTHTQVLIWRDLQVWATLGDFLSSWIIKAHWSLLPIPLPLPRAVNSLFKKEAGFRYWHCNEYPVHYTRSRANANYYLKKIIGTSAERRWADIFRCLRMQCSKQDDM